MKKITPAIIVEGKYDKIRLSNLFDTVITETNGFSVFSNKKKQNLIKTLAFSRGIIIFTDSDGAGFVIRNFIKNICRGGTVFNAYIPDIYGKEKRKGRPSKENKLGVEGINDEILEKAIAEAAPLSYNENRAEVAMAELFELGLSGRENSGKLRKKLLEKWNLPEHLSGKAFLDVVNSVYSYEELKEETQKLFKEDLI